ncbi:MAG: ribosomal protein S18 acetylase RimI-like enzyme [Sphingobacteriales bacterium]|jgi:ribosomal protein S18 acetylase RimI-like enzyme
MAIQIVNFRPEFASFVKSLNVEWLQTHFVVEEIDERELSDPQQYILDKGGYIYFVVEDGAVLGTASLIPRGNGEIELGKMAIAPEARGKGLGHLLMDHIIAASKRLNFPSIFLFSNTKLASAIHLYRKYGFLEIPLGNALFSRADIKMKLDLED